MAPDESVPDAPRVALITGASRGIGLAIAAALARDGHAVALVARDAPRLDAAARELQRETGQAAITIAQDLRAAGATARVLAACTERLGVPDVVVNNAGAAPSGRFEDTDDETLDEVLDLHVRVPFALLRRALPAMRAERGGGVAIQLASTAGLRGFAFTAAYTAAKHAMVGLTRALDLELAREPSLRVFAVCPGFVDTDITRRAAEAIAARGRTSAADALAAMAAMNRIGRMHSAEEVAGAVARLCRERPDGCVLDLDQDPPAFVP